MSEHEASATDVTRYGAILHEAAHGADRTFCRPVVCRQFQGYARVLLVALAADGRITEPGRSLPD